MIISGRMRVRTSIPKYGRLKKQLKVEGCIWLQLRWQTGSVKYSCELGWERGKEGEEREGREGREKS